MSCISTFRLSSNISRCRKCTQLKQQNQPVAEFRKPFLLIHWRVSSDSQPNLSSNIKKKQISSIDIFLTNKLIKKNYKSSLGKNLLLCRISSGEIPLLSLKKNKNGKITSTSREIKIKTMRRRNCKS